MTRYILQYKDTKIAFDAPDEDSAVCVCFRWGEDHGLMPGDFIDLHRATGDELDLSIDESVTDF